MKLQKVLFAVAVIAIAGCGSAKVSNSLFNDADAMFAQMMIPHHEQAIVLAEMAENPTSGASPEVTSLAAQIKSAQGPEVELMKSFLTQWDVPVVDPGSMDHGSMDHGSKMKGMLSVEELAKLSTLSGKVFDKEWMLAMIAHHEGAIEMARTVEQSGKNLEVQALAKTIISGQQVEIDQMKAMLANL
ncbi:MAG: hypothetical protein RLZZ260_177 [Actinomycetota bacterium]